MRELSGLSHEEIASALGTSINGAKQAIFEARTALAEFAAGRSMACENVRELLFRCAIGECCAGDGSSAHLRECPACARFVAEFAGRTPPLRALWPPLLAATALLLRLGRAAPRAWRPALRPRARLGGRPDEQPRRGDCHGQRSPGGCSPERAGVGERRRPRPTAGRPVCVHCGTTGGADPRACACPVERPPRPPRRSEGRCAPRSGLGRRRCAHVQAFRQNVGRAPPSAAGGTRRTSPAGRPDEWKPRGDPRPWRRWHGPPQRPGRAHVASRQRASCKPGTWRRRRTGSRCSPDRVMVRAVPVRPLTPATQRPARIARLAAHRRRRNTEAPVRQRSVGMAIPRTAVTTPGLPPASGFPTKSAGSSPRAGRGLWGCSRAAGGVSVS